MSDTAQDLQGKIQETHSVLDLFNCQRDIASAMTSYSNYVAKYGHTNLAAYLDRFHKALYNLE